MSAPKGFDRPKFLYVVVVAVLFVLFLPLVVVALFSFNSGNTLIAFTGFSVQWYERLFENGDLLESLGFSLQLAVVVALISTVLGLFISLGILRGARSLGWITQMLVVLRVVTPETATGVAMLLMFTQAGVTLNNTTLFLSHIVLCVAFSAVVILSRLAGMGSDLEEAALDLGASRLKSLFLVVVPEILPALISAVLLSFVLSFDNFYTSFFTSGLGVTPLPVRIFSMLRHGVTPEVNAVGMLMLVITAVAIGLAFLLTRTTGARRMRAPRTEGAGK